MTNSIKVERARKNITQGQLAEMVGVSRQTINAIELGKYNPSTVLSLKMSRVFEVSVNDLFCLEDDD
ncbi:MAG: helix-turn-helix transcriptional regulator [Bacteroidota bacterium]|jgi:transcriptional regulator|nr:transcriptional regulator [Bacteroidetes oral taxon 274 str. F0058]